MKIENNFGQNPFEKKEEKNENVEKLVMEDYTHHPDIASSKFKSILDIEKKQEELLNSYEREHVQDGDVKIPDLSNEVRTLEKQLRAKKHAIPLVYCILLFLLLNILWFGIVQFVIIPKYTEENEELRNQITELQEQVTELQNELDLYFLQFAKFSF